MKRQKTFFRFFFFVAGMFPLGVRSQVAEQKKPDGSANDRVETSSVNLKTSADAKLEASLRATDSTFLLTLAGSGVGTGTIDVNDEAVLVLDNDSAVHVKSIAFQGFESKDFINVYKHDYAISQKSLEALSRHNLRMVRKYTLSQFKDIYLDQQSTGNLRALSANFLQQLDRVHLLSPKPVSVMPAFPGGKDVFLSFLNRNLKVKPPFAEAQKEASVQFLVDADGSVSNIKIVQSAGAPYDEELLRILKRMPKWKPALDEGREVGIVVSQPLKFVRQDSIVRIQF